MVPPLSAARPPTIVVGSPVIERLDTPRLLIVPPGSTDAKRPAQGDLPHVAVAPVIVRFATALPRPLNLPKNRPASGLLNGPDVEASSVVASAELPDGFIACKPATS